MRKIRLEIEETLTFTRFMVIGIKDNLDDETIIQVLDKAEDQSSDLDELESNFKKQGVKIIKSADDDDLLSPELTEVEIVAYGELEEGTE